MLEDEVAEFLGRWRYERAGETVSHRSGHEPRTVKTTSGSMNLERPRVRNASKLGFESRVLGKGVTRTHALESLVIHPGNETRPEPSWLGAERLWDNAGGRYPSG